jgi:integrase
VTHLRKVMLEELQRRNFSSATIRGYLGAVERFSRYFGKPPDQLGPDHIRQYQAHLLHQRKLAVGTVVNQVAAMRFFFRRVLKRRFPPDSIPYPKYSHHRMPRILSVEEVARLIDAAGNLQARTIKYFSAPKDATALARWNQWTTHRRVCRSPRTRGIRPGKCRSIHSSGRSSRLLRSAEGAAF